MNGQITVERRLGTLRGLGVAAPVRARTANAYAAVAARHNELYWTVPGPRLYAPVAAHARLGGQLLKSAGPPVRRQVGSAAAQSALLAGRIAFFDLQAPRDAGRYYRAAFAAAEEAGDKEVAAGVLAHMAFIPAFAGRGPTARALVNRAHGYADELSVVQRSWLYAVEAEVVARTGDGDRSAEALALAKDALEAPDSRSAPEWLDFFDHSRLSGFAGHCLLLAGKAGASIGALRAGLDALAEHAVKQRTVILADLASAHVRLGEIEAACAFVVDAVELLSERWYATAMDRINTVWSALRLHRDVLRVREIDELLRPWRAALTA